MSCRTTFLQSFTNCKPVVAGFEARNFGPPRLEIFIALLIFEGSSNVHRNLLKNEVFHLTFTQMFTGNQPRVQCGEPKTTRQVCYCICGEGASRSVKTGGGHTLNPTQTPHLRSLQPTPMVNNDEQALGKFFAPL